MYVNKTLHSPDKMMNGASQVWMHNVMELVYFTISITCV